MAYVPQVVKLQGTNEAVSVYATRALAVTAIEGGSHTEGDGAIIRVGDLEWKKSTGATAISDMSDWIPVRPVSPAHWGASSSASAADNATAIEACLEYGGDIVTGGIGELTTNKAAITLTADTCLTISVGDSIKGATGLSSEILEFSGAYHLTINGPGKVDTSATAYNVGAASGTGIVLNAGLLSAKIFGIHFYAAGAKQSTYGDSGISGTASNVTIMACRFSGHPDAGIYHTGTATEDAIGIYDGPLGAKWDVIGNHFEYCQTAMVTKRNSWGGSFTNNEVEWCSLGFASSPADSGGVTLMSGKGWTISNNVFRKISARPIDLNFIGPHTVNGNLIVDFGYTDDGVTPQTAYGIWLDGAQGIAGSGNIICFREWTSTSAHAALYITENTFDSDGVNTVYEADRIDLSISVQDVYAGVKFGTGLSTTSGRVRIVDNGGITSTFTGTVPDDLVLEVYSENDVATYQNGAVAFRVVDGKIGSGSVSEIDAPLSIKSLEEIGSSDADEIQLARIWSSDTARNFRMKLVRNAAEGGTSWHNTSIRLEANTSDSASAQQWIELRGGASTSDNSIVVGTGDGDGSPIITMTSTQVVAHKPVKLQTYTVATVPTASSYTQSMIWVSDETGGAVPAYSDGTNWRRVSDGSVVS